MSKVSFEQAQEARRMYWKYKIKIARLALKICDMLDKKEKEDDDFRITSIDYLVKRNINKFLELISNEINYINYFKNNNIKIARNTARLITNFNILTGKKPDTYNFLKGGINEDGN